MATDIAQTSLTIDDIDAVIDSGIKKEVRLVSGIEGLYPTEISTSECRQRAGRAGRVKKGFYILCSERGMDDRLDYPEPEIRRLNLESVVLRMCKWGISPLEFNFFHRPNRSLILKAIQNLKNFGALTAENKVTADGRRMAELPLSVRSARLLLEAEKGGPRVTDRALKVIAIFETARHRQQGIRRRMLFQFPLQAPTCSTSSTSGKTRSATPAWCRARRPRWPGKSTLSSRSAWQRCRRSRARSPTPSKSTFSGPSCRDFATACISRAKASTGGRARSGRSSAPRS